jgi:hypothetical protein
VNAAFKARHYPTAEGFGVRKTETSHFWLGRFPDERRVAAYFAEVYD